MIAYVTSNNINKMLANNNLACNLNHQINQIIFLSSSPSAEQLNAPQKQDVTVTLQTF